MGFLNLLNWQKWNFLLGNSANCASLLPTVNSVCWAPHDYGLILACGSSDGAISLLTYTGEGQWEVKKINNAHTVSPDSACMWRVALLPCLVSPGNSLESGRSCVAALRGAGKDWCSDLFGGAASSRFALKPDRGGIQGGPKLHQPHSAQDRVWHRCLLASSQVR